MINARMRDYNYFLYSENNSYGQRTLIKDENGEPAVQGSVKLSVSLTSQSIQDNINYRNASYVALTYDKAIDDTYAIQYGDKVLKVLYVNPEGKYRQVFLGEI